MTDLINTHAYQRIPGYGPGACVYCGHERPDHDPSAVWNPTGGLTVPTSDLPAPTSDELAWQTSDDLVQE